MARGAISLLKEAAGFVVRWSGLAAVIRNTYARNKVSILLYHNPEPALLDRHLTYLRQRYTFIPLQELVDAIHAHDTVALPAKGLVIPFDDGERENLAVLETF